MRSAAASTLVGAIAVASAGSIDLTNLPTVLDYENNKDVRQSNCDILVKRFYDWLDDAPNPVYSGLGAEQLAFQMNPLYFPARAYLLDASECLINAGEKADVNKSIATCMKKFQTDCIKLHLPSHDDAAPNHNSMPEEFARQLAFRMHPNDDLPDPSRTEIQHNEVAAYCSRLAWGVKRIEDRESYIRYAAPVLNERFSPIYWESAQFVNLIRSEFMNNENIRPASRKEKRIGERLEKLVKEECAVLHWGPSTAPYVMNLTNGPRGSAMIGAETGAMFVTRGDADKLPPLPLSTGESVVRHALRIVVILGVIISVCAILVVLLKPMIVGAYDKSISGVDAIAEEAEQRVKGTNSATPATTSAPAEITEPLIQ